MNGLLRLDDIEDGDAHRVGRKAHVLARLRRAGFPVPDGVVVTPEASVDPAALRAACGALGETVAVRSSSTAEDADDASFAGQYATRLEVRGEDAIAEAVAWVRASAEGATGYARAFGLGTGQMAVLVQRMAGTRAAGVTFTRDPRDASALVVEARAGTGDAVVSGEVTPDRYVLDRRTRSVRKAPASAVLDATTLARVADLALRVEAAMGTPQDVEWALEHDGRLALLQARPITVDAEDRIDPRVRLITRANVGEVLPGPVSPLTESTVVTFLEHAFREVCARTGLLPSEAAPFQVIHRRRLYLNLSLCVEVAARLPGLTPEAAEALVLGRGSVDRRPAPGSLSPGRAAVVLAGVLGLARTLPRWVIEAQAIEKALPAATASLHHGTPAELRRGLERFLNWGRALATTHVAVSGASGVRLVVLEEVLRRVALGDPKVRVNRLVGGLDDVASAEPTVALEEIARDAAAEPEWRAWLEAKGDAALAQAPPSLRSRLEDFLERFGHRAVAEGELHTAAWRDDPAPVIAALAGLCASPEGIGLGRKTRVEERRAEQEALLSRCGVLSGAVLGWAIREAQAGVRLRERTKSALVRLAQYGREVARASARTLVSSGALDREEDVFLLRVEELLAALTEGRPVSKALLARRRRRQAAEGALPAPKEVDLQSAASEAEPPEDVAGILRGQGVSAGTALGPARVVKPHDRLFLVPGEVLVAPVLDAAYGPLLASAAGAVAEVGGMLSHGAVVAREIGVPCVVEVKDATRRIRTGERVLVDGSSGEVSVLRDQAVPSAAVDPLATLEPETGEEGLHELAHHPRARESVYFNPQDPASGVGLICSLGTNRRGRGEAVLALTLPDGRVLLGFERSVAIRRDPRGFAVGGFRAEWPPVRLRVEARLSAHEGASFPPAPHALLLAPLTVPVSIDLRFVPFGPTVDFCRGLSERTRSALKPLGDHHLEQAGAFSGSITIDGRLLPFSGVGHRDHSWGLREWDGLDHSRLFVASFGDDLAVHALSVVARGQAVEGGFVWRNGRASRITRILYATAREGTRLRSFDLRILTADGPPLSLRGTPWRTVSIPVQPEHRPLRHLAGRPYRLLLHESFTRYEHAGRSGYGIAEFSERPRLGDGA